MLTAAVAGNVFASPSVSSILTTIRKITGKAGALLIVKNYTGDRLNFGMALEKARNEGYSVKMVVVADDCALEVGKGITGGRGIAGTVFVHKVAGATAAAGQTLEDVALAAQSAADNIATLGVALTTCCVPGAPRSNRLDGEIIEIGMGIHGESGREQMPMSSADSIVEKILDTILLAKSLPLASPLAVMVNNLGGTPSLEMYVVTRRVVLSLRERGYIVARVYVGVSIFYNL